jgi:hypothetical protein
LGHRLRSPNKRRCLDQVFSPTRTLFDFQHDDSNVDDDDDNSYAPSIGNQEGIQRAVPDIGIDVGRGDTGIDLLASVATGVVAASQKEVDEECHPDDDSTLLVDSPLTFGVLNSNFTSALIHGSHVVCRLLGFGSIDWPRLRKC